MKSVILIASIIAAAATGCAGAPQPEERALDNIRSVDTGKEKILVSDKAYELISAKGEASAAFRGFSDDSEIICEHLQLRSSRMKRTFCYTRAERDRMNLNHQESWRRILQPVSRGGN